MVKTDVTDSVTSSLLQAYTLLMSLKYFFFARATEDILQQFYWLCNKYSA